MKVIYFFTVALASVFAPEICWAQFGPDFENRVKIEVVREKKTRTEGGDFDDKLSSIAMRIKFRNTDPTNEYKEVKGRIAVFGKNVDNRRQFKVLLIDKFSVDLAPREEIEVSTKKVREPFDDQAYVKWGFKYEGWVLEIRDSDDEPIAVMSSHARFEKALSRQKMSEGNLLDSDMKDY